MDKYLLAPETMMREERWILTSELFEGDEPPAVTAFRVFNDEAWETFKSEVSPMKFYNKELGRFSSCETWEDLCASEFNEPYNQVWQIPLFADEELQDLCRFVRAFCCGLGVKEVEDVMRVFHLHHFSGPHHRIIMSFGDNPVMREYFTIPPDADDAQPTEAFEMTKDVIAARGFRIHQVASSCVHLVKIDQ